MCACRCPSPWPPLPSPSPCVPWYRPATTSDQHPDGLARGRGGGYVALARDRAKAGLYAAAGVVEYWLVSLGDGAVEVYATPGPDGYATMTQHARGVTLRVPRLADVEVRVARGSTAREVGARAHDHARRARAPRRTRAGRKDPE